MIPRYSRKEMSDLWSDEARFKLWLEIETLALEALVKEGVAPQSALDAVRKKGNFDTARVLEIEHEVKHDVIAFLTNVAEYVGEGARYLHMGMTSSDLLDTCFSVQLTKATDIILNTLQALMLAVKIQAEAHRQTVCVGRSHGIHAEPTTFGLKLASFYAELDRQRVRLLAARKNIAVGAISGPVGTFAHLGTAIEAQVCAALGLAVDPISTQVISRDRHAEVFLAYAQLGSTLDRICTEVRHLQRTEVREAEEFFSAGQKGSSAMPHKRNPVLSENVCGLARLLRGWAVAALENVPLWHERDISHSSAERVIGPDATITLDFMLERTRSIIEKLVVYPERMKENLDFSQGLVFSGALLNALAEKGLSREDAYRLVQSHAMKVWEEISAGAPVSGGQDFSARVRGDVSITKLLSAAELDRALSLEPHLSHVDEIFSRVFFGGA